MAEKFLALANGGHDEDRGADDEDLSLEINESADAQEGRQPGLGAAQPAERPQADGDDVGDEEHGERLVGGERSGGWPQQHDESAGEVGKVENGRRDSADCRQG